MRQIYIVNCSQVVVSQAHPEGVYSIVDSFPKSYDSRTYPAPDGNPNGDSDTALVVAEARYHDEIEALTVAKNTNRVMWCVTITRADGVQIARKSWGAMPDMTPEPEPEPEPDPEPVVEEAE